MSGPSGNIGAETFIPEWQKRKMEEGVRQEEERLQNEHEDRDLYRALQRLTREQTGEIVEMNRTMAAAMDGQREMRKRGDL